MVVLSRRRARAAHFSAHPGTSVPIAGERVADPKKKKYLCFFLHRRAEKLDSRQIVYPSPTSPLSEQEREIMQLFSVGLAPVTKGREANLIKAAF